MLFKLLFVAALASSALSRHVPRYADLDEEDQALFRAAYDAPYEQDEYQEEEQVPGKLDLLKDGMWALKAKIKEMKTFHKALAAHLLATKLQVKELLTTLKKHQHVEVDKKKPVYHYQSPSPAPAYYEPPHYTAPAPHDQYSQHPSPQYAPSQYAPPKYDPPASVQYPQVQYEAHQYAAPPPAPQYSHDPYSGY